MANQSEKKQAKEAAELAAWLQKLILGVNAVYVVVRVALFFSSVTYWHMLGFLFTSIVYWGCYSARVAHAVNVGGVAEGFAQYYDDVMMITGFIQITSLISDWFWLVYLVIPMYALVQLWKRVLAPWIFTPDPVEETEQERKRREKKERKQNRVVYRR